MTVDGGTGPFSLCPGAAKEGQGALGMWVMVNLHFSNLKVDRNHLVVFDKCRVSYIHPLPLQCHTEECHALKIPCFTRPTPNSNPWRPPICSPFL